MENIFRLCDTVSMSVETVGGFIRYHRKRVGLTQVQLAVAIGMTDRSISEWETGRAFPGRDALARLAAVFRISLDEFRRFLSDLPDETSEEWQKSIEYLSQDEQEERKRQAIRLIDDLLADPRKLDQWVEYGEWLRGRAEIQ